MNSRSFALSTLGVLPIHRIVETIRFLRQAMVAVVACALGVTVPHALAGSPAVDGARAATVASPLGAGQVSVVNGRLMVGDRNLFLTGVNAPNHRTDWHLQAAGCMSEAVNLPALFDALGPDSLVRVWFTQGMATTAGDAPARDWSALDETVRDADASPNHPHLLITLTSGSGDCDWGRWHGQRWFETGWNTDVVPGSLTTYERWVDDVVTRYRDHPSVAVWEPVNEPDGATCAPGHEGSGCFGHGTCLGGATVALASFYTRVGAHLHAIAPSQLVSDGGGGWCGWDEAGAPLIDRSPGIDIIGLHDYHEDGTALPAKLVAMLRLGRELAKPVLIGEVGMNAREGTGSMACQSSTRRSELLAAKLQAARRAGAAGFVLWSFQPGSPPSCNLDIRQDDPAISILGSSPMPSSPAGLHPSQRAI
jgi:hypothetical protein